MKINRIRPEDHTFTRKLGEISDAPQRINYIGQLPDESLPVVAVVGSRKPTRYGIEVTQRLTYDLAKRGVVIVSGLALGIDAVAHQAALEAGGKTIAVVTNALPDISPRSNLGLAKRIVENGGAIMSEWGEGDDKLVGKWSFLERNRLVSGVSDAVLVTEAAAKSGTLNTVGHALNQGREVFAVPGNITSPLSEGCNSLLAQGAHLAVSAESILEVIAPELILGATTQTKLALGDNPAENTILELLASGLRDGEQLQQKSGLSASDFATALTMLEINGLVKPLGANQWTTR
ncbi:DNA protecting protein DprA [Candidatus Saccharibacteria bacterium 32-49-12]|nr:MAG: DNA protecting protein DprA [Candidatus Saccharibacteria bacterium 32-49-12]